MPVFNGLLHEIEFILKQHLTYQEADVPTQTQVSYIGGDIQFQDDHTCLQAREPNEGVLLICLKIHWNI